MRATLMRDLLLEQRERMSVWNRTCTLEDWLGAGQVLGGEHQIHSVHSYVCVWSDDEQNPFISEAPDAVYLLEDTKGMCVFLYELED